MRSFFFSASPTHSLYKLVNWGMKASGYWMAVLLFSVTHSLYSQILPAARSTNWSLAGYPGNIPVYATIRNIMDYGGNSNGTAANDVALQNAISSLSGQNGTIYFPAGTFTFTSPVVLRSGLILKGEGALNTILKFDLAGNFSLINIAGSLFPEATTITTTILKGAYSFTVADASLFHTGDYIKLYQNDTALINDAWALESVGQVVQIDSVKSNLIYFHNEARRNYLLSNAPRVKKLEMVAGVGIECLKIKRMDATAAQTSNIRFTNAANCWVKGVESDSCNFAHVKIETSTNIEVTNNYFHGAFAYGGTGQGYGISCEYTSGECLIENNIFKHLRHSMLVQSGANANVFAYNYSSEPFKTDTIPNDFSGDIVLHGNYPYLNLFEGNIVQNIIADASHRINGPFNTFFRNRAESYGLFILPGAGDSTNVIGNEITGTTPHPGSYFIFGAGNFSYGNNWNSTIIPAGTRTLDQQSLIYSNTPFFWNVTSTWPSIGSPKNINSGTIPAYYRFNQVQVTVYCLPSQPVTCTFTGIGNWSNAANWINNTIPPPVLPPGSQIIIDPPQGQKCVLDVSYVINPGTTLVVKQGKQFEVGANLTFVQ